MYHGEKEKDEFLILQTMVVDKKTQTYIQLIPDHNFCFSEKRNVYSTHLASFK